MKRKIAVSIASVALCLGGLVVAQAGATTRTVGASGGSLTFTATVRNATTCAWSSRPTITGFAKTVKCKTGTVARSARFTANTWTTAKSYEVTLIVRGKTTTIDRWKVNQAGETPPTKTTTTTTTTVPPTTTTTASSMFYISLGDSYAAGSEDAGGYTTKVVTDVAPTHTLILRNFACGGATTTSMMSAIGCSGVLASPDGVAYPTTTQLAAAISFIDAHPGQIGLITITIGGNDLGGTADNASTIATNIANISAQLRAAAGTSVPIIGLTYFDVDLADWLSGPSGVAIAKESVTAVQQVINPDWKTAYASSNVAFVDVDAASGAYTPLTQLVNYSTYGEIPYAVAQVCILTNMCSQNDVHPTDAGYTLIAQQIVLAYLQLVS
jgi:lysophospholipase L1-like esterase